MSSEAVDIADHDRLGADRNDLWVERTGSRTYVGRNGRGAELRVGGSEDDGAVFSPGELLKIALAACTGLTIDAALARRFGDDVEAIITASGSKDVAEDRYPVLQENLRLDVSGLGEKELTRLRTVVRRGAEEHCTVARTITRGTTVELSINGTLAH